MTARKSKPRIDAPISERWLLKWHWHRFKKTGEYGWWDPDGSLYCEILRCKCGAEKMGRPKCASR